MEQRSHSCSQQALLKVAKMISAELQESLHEAETSEVSSDLLTLLRSLQTNLRPGPHESPAGAKYSTFKINQNLLNRDCAALPPQADSKLREEEKRALRYLETRRDCNSVQAVSSHFTTGLLWQQSKGQTFTQHPHWVNRGQHRALKADDHRVLTLT